MILTRTNSGTSYDPNAAYVLRMLGSPQGQHVNHGMFWGPASPGTDLGTGFFWDGWVRPLGSGYLISDGYGGAHALLWGWSGSPGAMTGNVWTGATPVSFGGTYNFAAGEWAHVAVGWYSGQLYVYTNGVPAGQTAFAGPRKTALPGGGAGVLYVGGSTHINGYFDIAALRGWDRNFNPHLGPSPFIPERTMGRTTNIGANPCDFYCDYTVPGKTLLDTSPMGVEAVPGQGRSFHHGRLYNNGQTAVDFEAFDVAQTLSPTPQWLLDPSCPYGQPIGSPLPAESVPAPIAPPTGCLAWDSFGRRNQTYAFQAVPTLGSTEAGSLGPLAWQTGFIATPAVAYWGILQGAAVALTYTHSIAWVPLGTANMDVRVRRSTESAYDVGETGLAFRVQDQNNWWSAYLTGGSIVVGKALAGSTAELNVFACSGTYSHIRATAVGTTLTFYCGDGTNWTQVGQLTGQTDLQAATGAGLCNSFGAFSFNGGSRYREFAAFAG